jgi:DNA-binding response OmpR family regulator
VSRHAVLIFSADPLAAALLGAVVELAGHAPHFARQDEAARTALMRVRPRLVLIDCDHEETCSDAFVGPALMTGSEVVLYRSRRTQRESREFAGRLGLRVVELPNDQEKLLRLLQELLAG